MWESTVFHDDKFASHGLLIELKHQSGPGPSLEASILLLRPDLEVQHRNLLAFMVGRDVLLELDEGKETPRLQLQTLWIGVILTGKMTFWGDKCLTS